MPETSDTKSRDTLPKRPDAGLLPAPHRRSIVFFCLATFLFWIALYIYVPILPVYARSLGASLSMVGIVVASYAVPQLLLRIPIGVLHDVLSRRKILVAGGIAITSAGALGLGLAPNPWLLTLARAVTGLGAATWVTFTVYFTGYYHQEGTGRAIGIINFVQRFALVIATSCGGVIAEAHGFTSVFFIAAITGIVALLGLLFAREPAGLQVRTAASSSFMRVAAHPLLLTASFMAVLLQFSSFAIIFGFIPVYASGIGASNVELGIITMVAVGSSAVASLIAVNLAERYGNTFTIILGAAFIGMATLAIPFIPHVYLLETVMVAYGLGSGVLGTILMALSIRSVAPQQRATAMGVYQAIYAAGMLLGPLLSGFVGDSLGLASVFYLSASLCLVIAGLAFLPVIPGR